MPFGLGDKKIASVTTLSPKAVPFSVPHAKEYLFLLRLAKELITVEVKQELIMVMVKCELIMVQLRCELVCYGQRNASELIMGITAMRRNLLSPEKCK